MLSLLPNVGLLLALLSGLQTTLATPLPHSQEHPDYHGLPSNVLFPFKGKSCDDIAKAQSLRGSFEFDPTNPETASLAETMGEAGLFDGITHTWLNLVKGNTKWLMGFPRNYDFSAMVWTIDESLYRFEIGQAPLYWKAISNPDNPKEKYFVDTKFGHMDGWKLVAMNDNGNDRFFACKDVDHDWYTHKIRIVGYNEFVDGPERIDQWWAPV